MKNPAIYQEPAPTQGRTPVWPDIIRTVNDALPDAPLWLRLRLTEDMRARDAMGREKYGTPLQTHNGRDAAADAYQEALDLCAYTFQRHAETQAVAWLDIHCEALKMAARIRYQWGLENGEGVA